MGLGAANSLLSLPCCSPSLQFSSHRPLHYFPNPTPTRCSSNKVKVKVLKVDGERIEYKPGLLDNIFLNFFRNKMVQVRVLKSLFPAWLLVLFKMLVAPIADGKVASMMNARATAFSCKWLMGPCSVNSVVLPDGKSCSSGVFVEKCKYLEESKCIGICINTCKIPTQTFFRDYMGVELYMEPNFEDYSCQFNFGVPAVSPTDDKALKEPCLEICTNANRRRELGRRESDIIQCPQL
ncbi:beta-carotene isomerase D27 isoform X2 [Carex rostrata]